MLRICERFGLNPFRDWDAMTAGEQAVLIAHEQVRRAEEARVGEKEG